MKELNISYASWKLVAAQGLPGFYENIGTEEAPVYNMYSCGSEFFFSARTASAEDVANFVADYKDDCAEISGKDEAFTKGLIANQVLLVQPGIATTSSHEMKVVDQLREGTEKNFYMPNLTDPCAWWEKAVEVANQALTDSGDGLTWEGPASDKWIDLFHHRLHDEEKLDRDKYLPVVEVSADAGDTWTPVTECHQAWDPVNEAWDYTLIPAGEVFIHYGTSKVVFGTSQSGKLVRASYYKADGYQFTVEPNEGKVLKIAYAEVQGSEDMEFNCSIAFSVYAGETLVGKTVYGTLWGYVSESKGNYPTIPAFGGKHKFGEVFRGLQNKVAVLPFPYLAAQTLYASYGMKLVVEFEEGTGPWGGEFGNGTFYCMVDDE